MKRRCLDTLALHALMKATHLLGLALRLKNLLALSAADTARLFRVSTNTVLRWEDDARAAPERGTVGSLLKPVSPVRRYADIVRNLVQTMILARFPGDRSVALHLARAGWRASPERSAPGTPTMSGCST